MSEINRYMYPLRVGSWFWSHKILEIRRLWFYVECGVTPTISVYKVSDYNNIIVVNIWFTIVSLTCFFFFKIIFPNTNSVDTNSIIVNSRCDPQEYSIRKQSRSLSIHRWDGGRTGWIPCSLYIPGPVVIESMTLLLNSQQPFPSQKRGWRKR